MLITDLKIEVTLEMMQAANMTRGNQYGVPVDPSNPARGLKWKTFVQLQDDDFDKIEDYFLAKKAKA